MAAALGLAATGASADGPGHRGSIKDGPHPAPVLVWSGLYFSAAVAQGIGTTDLIVGDSVDVSLKGVQGVVAVGYDWQLSPKWVLGVFGDYAFGEIDGTTIDLTSVIDEQWAIGGRLGLLATPSTFFYASGGYTRANYEFFDGNVASPTSNNTLGGFFVGLGVEQAINRNFSLKVDYRFSDYEDFTDDNINFVNEVHSVRFGVSWKFGRDDRALVK